MKTTDDVIRAHDGYSRWSELAELSLLPRISYSGLQQAALVTLLIASVLFAGTLQAQRGAGASRGTIGRGAVSSGLGGRPGFRGHARIRNSRNNAMYDPFYDYGEPSGYDQASPVAPPFMVMRPESRYSTEGFPASSPKVIELPGTANSAVSKSQPAAVFVLTNGERLETRRYWLTHDNLYLTIDRQQHTIPLARLDVNATIVADRERGINLRIPTDQNEISLSF